MTMMRRNGLKHLCREKTSSPWACLLLFVSILLTLKVCSELSPPCRPYTGYPHRSCVWLGPVPPQIQAELLSDWYIFSRNIPVQLEATMESYCRFYIQSRHWEAEELDSAYAIYHWLAHDLDGDERSGSYGCCRFTFSRLGFLVLTNPFARQSQILQSSQLYLLHLYSSLLRKVCLLFWTYWIVH